MVPATWPAIAYETLQWEPSDAGVSKSQRIKLAGPYAAAIPPKISDLTPPTLPASTLAISEEAIAAIARFDTEFGSGIASFPSLLLRTESMASSKIENLSASAKAIALAEVGDASKHNANIIVANTRAMEAAIQLADNLDETAILAMHKALLQTTHPQWAGKWRDEPVWIGGSNLSPKNATFVPPRHELVPEAINDLVRFLRRNDLPVLIQAAIAHAQFETIHPFPDGNGRVGRAIIHSLTRAKGLTQNVTVPISAGLLANTDRYFASLEAYRTGNVQQIVELITNAVFLAIDNGKQLVEQLQTIREQWTDLITARKDAAIWKVLDVVIRQPVVDSALLQARIGASAPAVNAAIGYLEKAEILTKVSGKHRDKKWAANDVLIALDDFAERSGRRG